ncbi:hypothetical protein DIURU_004893 [Diutina rugosa]|uniref:Histone-lysine N-methyltransferase, H3 lysine-4 specific n=1 Tax=Diutina rugosa TaxID=5481 RepID=A0A642UFH3_DIURU|nr:uncharacterized protein DIURU_004893 [Diutina rugosa]KAA8898039.1 hypothetical protein DIURU_004893 [Diutina rugosa]
MSYANRGGGYHGGASRYRAPNWGRHRDNGGNSKYGSPYHNGDHRDHYPKPLSRELTPRRESSLPQLHEGTKLDAGECSNDDQYQRQSHHQAVLRDAAAYAKPSKVYRIIYDPELDSSLSKQDKKLKKREFKFSSSQSPQDPRKANIVNYFQKPNKKSKKFPFKQLPQAKYGYSKESIGPAPQTRLVVWDLPISITEGYFKNYFQSYGQTKNVILHHDEEFAVPLGVASFEFEGQPEKSSKIARKFLSDMKQQALKIDGADLHIGLDDDEDRLLHMKIDRAKDTLRAEKRKRDEEERKQRKFEELKRRNEEKRKHEEMKKQQAEMLRQDVRSLTNVTIASKYHGSRVKHGYQYPHELNRHIKNRPFILIKSRYVPPKVIPASDVKRCLEQYRWSRIIDDRSGFYVVFKSVKEADRCFKREDCRNFYEYTMVMDLAIPPNWEEPIETRSKDSVVEEAVTMLLKDFQQFLAKDIRERVIAPTVLDLLNHDHYPDTVAKLKKEEEQRKAKEAAKVVINTNDQLKQNALQILRSKQEEATKRAQQKSRTKVIPLQHALNYESDIASGDEVDSENEPTKRRLSIDDFVVDEIEEKSHKRSKKSLLYGSEDESEPEPEIQVDVEEPKTEAIEDYKHLPERFWPTEGFPTTVFEETAVATLPGERFSLSNLQSVLKDDEDLALAREVLADIADSSNIKNIEYWAWKQHEEYSPSHEISEDLDLIEQLDSSLENWSGSFRSEGYRKIKEADKIAYLPHKRQAFAKARNIKQEEEDDEGTPRPVGGLGSSTNVSSRVNRANNRRFAAEVNAQLGSETEVLSLNALTKRKKPVTFARSTIHNWGLYALEPIAAKEMIIEYVGESIRQAVAEVRERAYMKTGIGSSYLFRIDENTVIDATKKGGIARFINHCCSPSCTAKIIKVEGKKRIVIYALRDIEANEELTYDYKFERETNDEERIRCLCGAPGCKGYLN